MTTHTGACLCGTIPFAVTDPLPAPNACHRVQCRMQSGHVGASVDVDRTAHSVIGTPVWFASSDTMRRGFCGICDAVLFRDPLHGPRTAVAMRAFDDPTGTRLALHIFTSQQDDAYDIVDGLPQNPR